MKRIVNSALNKLGYRISKNVEEEPLNPLEQYDYGSEALENMKTVKAYSMMPDVNLITLYEQAVYCEKNNIEGAFVECGVWKGGAVGMMALANLKYGSKPRALHLFDAFDDIPEPDPGKDGKKAIDDFKKFAKVDDGYKVTGELKPAKGFYDDMGGAGTINVCRELISGKIKYPEELTFYHKGWFQDTVPVKAGEIEKIAILRLDGDWYDSIKICLNNLYDKVSDCGLIIIDDYGYYEGCTRAVDEFLSERGIKTFLSYSNPGCRYFVKAGK